MKFIVTFSGGFFFINVFLKLSVQGRRKDWGVLFTGLKQTNWNLWKYIDFLTVKRKEGNCKEIILFVENLQSKTFC